MDLFARSSKNPILKPRNGTYFDSYFVEMGPAPIETDKGWLVLYHGVNRQNVYRLGFLILDTNDLRKIIYRSATPIFEPREPYEVKGIVDILPGGWKKMQKMDPNELQVFIKKYAKEEKMPLVAFVCGATLTDGLLRIYYGASDTFICTATAKLDSILNLAK